MKTKTLTLLMFLFLAGIFSSCKDEISDATGVWICNPEPDVTITLTFTSGKVSVSTSPQELGYVMASGKTYLLHNGDQYIVRGNRLYYVNPNASVADNGFIGEMLSYNRMKLKSFGGGIPFPNNGIYIADYLFVRK